MGFKNLIDALEGDNLKFTLKEIDIENRYKKAVMEYSKREEQGNPSEYYRPSSLSAMCSRMLYYQRKQVEKDEKTLDDMEVNLKGITNTGTHRHEVIQDIVKEMEGFRYLTEEEIIQHIKDKGLNTKIVEKDGEEFRLVNEDLSISFQPDGILEVDNQLVILEIKTMSIFGWNSLKEPVKRHIRQASTYATGLGIDRIIFMYEDRNFTRMKVFIYDVEKEIVEEIKEVVRQTNKHIKENTLPPKSKDKDSCKYCDYKNRCKEAN